MIGFEQSVNPAIQRAVCYLPIVIFAVLRNIRRVSGRFIRVDSVHKTRRFEPCLALPVKDSSKQTISRDVLESVVRFICSS